jgi:hypothetical protein
MILIDTKVISEPMKAHGDANVAAWLDAQVAETLYISAVSLSELLLGIETLPQGKRRKALTTTLADQISALFGDRVLSFDLSAARAYAAIVSRTRKAGYAISVPDGQIAAIAETHRFAIATRDEAPFRAAGLAVINPWTSES